MQIYLRLYMKERVTQEISKPKKKKKKKKRKKKKDHSHPKQPNKVK